MLISNKRNVYYLALTNFAFKQDMYFKECLIGFQAALHIDKLNFLKLLKNLKKQQQEEGTLDSSQSIMVANQSVTKAAY